MKAIFQNSSIVFKAHTWVSKKVTYTDSNIESTGAVITDNSAVSVTPDNIRFRYSVSDFKKVLFIPLPEYTQSIKITSPLLNKYGVVTFAIVTKAGKDLYDGGRDVIPPTQIPRFYSHGWNGTTTPAGTDGVDYSGAYQSGVFTITDIPQGEYYLVLCQTSAGHFDVEIDYKE